MTPFRLFSQVQVTDWFNTARQKFARQAQFARIESTAQTNFHESSSDHTVHVGHYLRLSCSSDRRSC
jgi:hypothetical protein